MHNNPQVYIDPYGLWREETRDLVHGISRGALDDTTWNATNLVLGEFQPKNNFDKVGYHVGTAGSFAVGLFYGASEVKIAKGIYTLFRKTLHKAPSQSLKALSAAKTISKIEKTQTAAEIAKIPEKISLIKRNIPCVDKISQSGQVMDRSGLTKAGRSLDKHGNRANNSFSKATGNPASKNNQGQFHLDDILTDPKNTVFLDVKNGGFKVYLEDGRGAYIKNDGIFRGFIERACE